MREHLFFAVALVATFQQIFSVPTFVFVESSLVFTILVKNTVLVWRSSALGDTFLSEFVYDILKIIAAPNLPRHSIIPFILPYAECVNFDLSWIHGWLETMRTRTMVGLRQIWHFGLYLLFLIRHILHSLVV